MLYCLHVHRVFYADYQTIFTKTERGIQVVYFRTYQYLHMNARFNLQFFWQKLTSSGKIRVKSYTVEIAFSAWSLVGRHSITSDSMLFPLCMWREAVHIQLWKIYRSVLTRTGEDNGCEKVAHLLDARQGLWDTMVFVFSSQGRISIVV